MHTVNTRIVNMHIGVFCNTFVRYFRADEVGGSVADQKRWERDKYITKTFTDKTGNRVGYSVYR